MSVRWWALLLTVFIYSNLWANDKYALVIGNGNYTHADHLPNPVNDSKAVASQLKALGFDVVQGVDMTKSGMGKILRKFSDKLRKNTDGVAVFFYAGHGIQKDGINYLIPVNADIKNDYEVRDASVNLQWILEALNESAPRLTIALVDACRDNPFEKRIRGVTRNIHYRGSGLAAMHDIRGTILSYATEPGSTAVDGYGDHSPYTSGLLNYLKVPELSVQDMLNEVGLAVMTSTHGDQKPWYASSPIARFCFGGCRQQQVARARLGTAGRPASGRTALFIRKAMANRDISTIRKLAILDTRQDKMLRHLFKSYSRFKVSTTVTRSMRGRLTVDITEATNVRGNRVIPAKNWKTFTLMLRTKR